MVAENGGGDPTQHDATTRLSRGDDHPFSAASVRSREEVGPRRGCEAKTGRCECLEHAPHERLGAAIVFGSWVFGNRGRDRSIEKRHTEPLGDHPADSESTRAVGRRDGHNCRAHLIAHQYPRGRPMMFWAT